MRRVLLLATTTGYQIRSFTDAAARLGVDIVFASDRCDQLDDPWFDHAVPVRFWDEARSLEAILDACRRDPIQGVIAVGDHPAILAARAAAALGLPGNPPDAVRTSRNKLASRRAFQGAGLLTPTFFEVSMTDDPSALAASVTYPVVLKPLALAGSRGVMRADRASDFVWAFERLAGLLKAPDILNERDDVHGHALVESYIPGNEYAVEGVMTDGVFRAFVIFDKPDPLVGPFFEETLYVRPSRAPDVMQEAILDGVAAATRALGLRHGPIHAECRVNTKGVYLLEVAARPIGGLCARAVGFHGPQDYRVPLEEVLIRHSLGEDIEPWTTSSDASGVMMIPIPKRGVYRGVQGVKEAAALDGVDDIRITAKTDQLLLPLPEGRSYLGFIFASGKNPASVEQTLRHAHAMLTFEIDREIELAR
jgi:biotin carboxylase